MSKETAIVKTDEKVMEYVPFGSSEKIKLSVAIVKNLICVPTRSGKRCSDNDAIKFMMMCQARALNPFEGDAFLIGYDNNRDGGATYSLITAHQAFLKRAEVNAQYDGMESGIIYKPNADHEGEPLERQGDYWESPEVVVGGWAKVFFKNRSKPMYKRIRMSRFKKAFGLWLEDDAGMVVKCSEADALRSAFPTMLGGLYLKEEVEGKTSNMNTVTPVFSNAETTTVDVEPVAPVSSLEKVRELCKTSGITEAQLLTLLSEKGIIPDGSEMQDLEENPEVLDYVVEKWPDITKRKETSGKKSKDGNV